MVRATQKKRRVANFTQMSEHQKKAKERGILVVFEGVDRSGKTTQSTRIVSDLLEMGIPAVHMRFPDRKTATGKVINAYLQESVNTDDRAIHLLFSANRWEARDNLTKLINDGKVVVIDRYAYSGAAFSAAKGLDLDWCKGPDRGLPRPDLIIYLNLPITEASQRGGYGNERYEKAEFQEKVKRQFELLVEKDWSIIDATKSQTDITKEVQNLVLNVLKQPNRKPLENNLWL